MKAMFAALAVLVTCVMGPIEYAAALDMDSADKVMRVWRVLLEPSMNPASLEECQRAQARRPRPDGVVSFQNGERTPWHHRQCYWAMKGQP